jgi:hypothetical protein
LPWRRGFLRAARTVTTRRKMRYYSNPRRPSGSLDEIGRKFRYLAPSVAP